VTDAEITQRNHRLADWITRLHEAMSLLVDGHPLSAYRQVCRITDEMQAYALALALPRGPEIAQETVTEEVAYDLAR
jgi:hypothetical protein